MTAVLPSQAASAAAGQAIRATPAGGNAAYRLQSGSAVTAPHSFRSAPGHHLVRRSDPANRVMTDFTVTPAFTVSASCQIDDALDEMFRRGVRALIVRGEDDAVVGIVTSYDIQGERAQQALANHPARRREELRVEEVLTPTETCGAIDWRRVHSANVEELLDATRASNSPYLLVVETHSGGTAGILRGIISRTQLERQLGESP